MRRNRAKRGWRVALLLLAGLAGAGACAPVATPAGDPFAEANAAVAAAPAAVSKDDPFAPANKAPSAPTAPAETKAEGAIGKPADPRKPATADLIDFKVELAPASVRRGETAHLTIS